MPSALHADRKLALTALLLLLFIAPLAARTLESSGLDRLTEILSYAGYLWMGLLFLFVTAAAILDIANLFIAVITPGKAVGRQLSPRRLFVAAAAYTVIIGIYGYYEASRHQDRAADNNKQQASGKLQAGSE